MINNALKRGYAKLRFYCRLKYLGRNVKFLSSDRVKGIISFNEGLYSSGR